MQWSSPSQSSACFWWNSLYFESNTPIVAKQNVREITSESTITICKTVTNVDWLFQNINENELIVDDPFISEADSTHSR